MKNCQLTLKTKSIYDATSTASDYDRYFRIPEEELQSICTSICELVKEGAGEQLNVLFLGVGSGRLELPILNALAKSGRFKRVTAFAADQSNAMLRLLKKNAETLIDGKRYLDSSSIGFRVGSTKVKLNILPKDFSQDEAFNAPLTLKFDLITAFFSASSAESVGKFQLGESAKVVIKG